MLYPQRAESPIPLIAQGIALGKFTSKEHALKGQKHLYLCTNKAFALSGRKGLFPNAQGVALGYGLLGLSARLLSQRSYIYPTDCSRYKRIDLQRKNKL